NDEARENEEVRRAYMFLATAVACGGLALGLAACGSSDSGSASGATATSSGSGPVTGAGSTFIAPLMSKWQADYASKTGDTDTYAFTDYLSHVSAEWKSKVGTSTLVKFPTGQGASGSDGVGAAISSTDGAIGYLTIAYVNSNGFEYALLQNAAGNYAKATVSA